MMNEELITDRQDWKLKVFVKECVLPSELKHLKFTGEQYNEEGELTATSTYDFYLNKDEMVKLSNIFSK
jgi:hypothetical protein